MSKTKGGGSTRNGRDSAAKRLGPKVFDGQRVQRLLCRDPNHVRVASRCLVLAGLHGVVPHTEQLVVVGAWCVVAV